MPTREDYYGLLGLSRTASEKEIKRAYKKLARKYHPDVNPGDKTAEERFKKIQEAYSVLSDAKKREMYDRYGFYAEGFRPGTEGPARGFDFSGFDFSQRGPSSFADIFSDFFGGARQAAPRPERGRDLEHYVTVLFLDAIRGTTARINVSRLELCGGCGGTGSQPGAEVRMCTVCGGTGQVARSRGLMRFNTTCRQCGGTGKVRVGICPRCQGTGQSGTVETLNVKIPPGVRTGSRIRVPGKGDAGVLGGSTGDLYLVINVSPHEFFTREGDEIRCIVPVTVTEAALGTKIEVPTVEGKALLKIPPGTQSGQKFRLRGKGAPGLRTGRHGDQIVEIRIVLPRIFDERSKEILREFARLHPDNPRGALGLA